MKVCYLINSLEPAGAEHQLLEIVRNSQADIEFTVCHFGWGSALEQEFRDQGITVVDLGFRVPYDPVGMYNFIVHCREADLIHAHLPPSIVVARLCGSLTGTPVVSTHHNVPDNYGMFSRSLEKYTRDLDKRTIAVSDGVRTSFADSHKEQWKTIYNGINVGNYRSRIADASISDIQFDVDPDKLNLLNIARYAPQKRQTDLIEAFSRALPDLPPAQLFVVGWGDERESLEKKTRSCGVEDQVTITGRVPKVEPYYRLSDIFVSSSIHEGLPITFLEAMAAELPIIATQIPGVREVVRDGETGCLVEPEKPDALVHELIKQVNDGDLDQMGMRALKRVEREFSIQKTVNDHFELYNKVVL